MYPPWSCCRDQILEMEKQSKEDVIVMLSTMPSALEVDDVSDFCSLAQYYALKTPTSFRVVSFTPKVIEDQPSKLTAA